MTDKKLWQVRLIGNIQVFVYGYADSPEEIRDVALQGGVVVNVGTATIPHETVQLLSDTKGEVSFENAYARQVKRIPPAQS